MKRAIKWYQIALQILEEKGSEIRQQTIFPIEYLDYFKEYFKNHGVVNLYKFTDKYKLLKIEFHEILKNYR